MRINFNERPDVELYLSDKLGIKLARMERNTLIIRKYKHKKEIYSFSPFDLPNLNLWLDASCLPSLSTSGVKVFEWCDISLNGNDLKS